MKKILTMIFGTRAPAIPMKLGERIVFPINQPSFNQWCKEFNVSRLYKK